MPNPRHPQSFLETRVHLPDVTPPLTTVCAGYELQAWRAEQLAKHLIHWLPEFALRYSEREDLDASRAVELIGQAARTVYESSAYRNRGEFGEVLLHAILRQTANTTPAISKFFFKDARNDTVKGFDAVHVVLSGTELELWLGEVKFYSDSRQAVRDVMNELEQHLTRDYMRAEFAAITNKLDPQWPDAGRVSALLQPNRSLDQIFTRVCVPVLLTYDSDAVGDHSRVCEEYIAQLTDEVSKLQQRFAKRYKALLRSKRLPESIRVHLYLLPLKEKRELVRLMDAALRTAQAL